MKFNFTFILLFLLNFKMFGQNDTHISAFLQDIYLHKSELIDKQIFTQKLLEYDYHVNNINNKPESEIISKQFYSDSIVYSSKHLSNDTLIYRLHFNSNKQLVNWNVDIRDCYDRKSSDVPTPIYTNTSIKYNSHRSVKEILSNCNGREGSILTTYHYDSDNKLDSVTRCKKTGQLTLIDIKLIFIDSILSSGEKNGSTLLIIHNAFDYKNWIDYNYNEGTTINSREFNDNFFIQDISNSTPWRTYRAVDLNYIYQFDSVGRTISAACMDRNGGITSFFGNCESDNLDPAIIEIAYDEEGRMSWIDHLTCNSEYGIGFHTKGGRTKVVWRKNEIKEILFYNMFRCVEKWTPKRGLEFIPITPVPSDKKKRLLLENLDEIEQNTERQLRGFPDDSVLIFSNFTDWYGNPDTTNKYLVKKELFSWILSDTVNSIIRYLWIQSDDLTEVFYVSNKKIIKATRTSFGETTSIYPSSKNEYLLVENPWCLQNKRRPDIDEFRIYANKQSRVITPDDWGEKLNGLGRYNSCKLNQIVFDLKSNEYIHFENKFKAMLDMINE